MKIKDILAMGEEIRAERERQERLPKPSLDWSIVERATPRGFISPMDNFQAILEHRMSPAAYNQNIWSAR